MSGISNIANNPPLLYSTAGMAAITANLPLLYRKAYMSDMSGIAANPDLLCHRGKLICLVCLV